MSGGSQFIDGITQKPCGNDFSFPKEDNNNQVENLSREPKSRIPGSLPDNRNSPDRPVYSNVDGHVYIAPNTKFVYEGDGSKAMSRSALVFHELWENWERSSNHLPYHPENGKEGAHENAIREGKNSNQVITDILRTLDTAQLKQTNENNTIIDNAPFYLSWLEFSKKPDGPSGQR